MTIDEYYERIKSPDWRWWLITENVYAKNLNRIHPLKQRQVEAICKVARGCSAVDQIIIFGSSTTYKCNSCSDLDICIKWKGSPFDKDGMYPTPEAGALFRCIGDVCRGNGGYDLIFWEELDGAVVENTVKKEGVIVYE